TQLASLENQFGQTLLEASNNSAFIVRDTAKLNGLTANEIHALKVEGKTEWKIPIQNTTQQPFTQALTDRQTRENLFNKAWSRTDGGNYSTLDMIKEIVKLRIEKANLLGYPTYASWNLQDTMVKTTETVDDFFAQLVPGTVKAVNEEAKVLQEKIKSAGNDFELKPWDWTYYAEQFRKEKYDLDEGQLKPYFELKK